MTNTEDVTGGKSIAIWSQSNSDVSAVNSLVAFYDIHGIKGEAILLFCPVHHTRKFKNGIQIKLLKKISRNDCQTVSKLLPEVLNRLSRFLR
jgi:hypothetical protein